MPKILFILLFFHSFLVFSAEYQSKEKFLVEAFSGVPPKPNILWLKGNRKKIAASILQHKLGFMRTRYWQNKQQTVWVLDEIGKTKPITVAIIIKDKKITLLKVLEFRESRGWEVKHDFFTDQFKHNSINSDLKLAQPIDGISGATLSVRALTKIAQLALFFDSQISHEKE